MRCHVNVKAPVLFIGHIITLCVRLMHRQYVCRVIFSKDLYFYKTMDLSMDQGYLLKNKRKILNNKK